MINIGDKFIQVPREGESHEYTDWRGGSTLTTVRVCVEKREICRYQYFRYDIRDGPDWGYNSEACIKVG